MNKKMKKILIIFIVASAVIKIFAQIPELNIWNNIRNSSYTQDNQINIRCETIDYPIIQTDLFYLMNNEWIKTDMENLSGLTVEGIIQASQQENNICRFKTYGDTLTAMMPAYIPDDIFPPDIEQLSYIIADPEGDYMAEGPEQLDILGSYFGYSDTRFYLALKNNGTGFPVNEGGFFPSEYYIYLAGLINPENALIDTVGYALVRVEIPLFFQPGLYRFAGSELSLDNLQQIGEIETAVVDSFLIMACSIDDLTNDEYFGNWPSISRSLGLDFITAFVGFDSQFELTYDLMDFSLPSLQVIDQYIIEPFVNDLPQISNISANIVNDNTFIQLDYYDLNHNFPLVAQVSTEQNEIFSLTPTSFDFSLPVVYYGEIPETDWNSLTFVFSDNGYEFVEETIYNTPLTDESIIIKLSLFNHPNPFNPETLIQYDLPEPGPVTLSIFNAKSQLIEKLIDNEIQQGFNKILWNGEKHPSGIYLYRLECGEHQIARKMLMLK
jgi:hypothetical protein